jgi:tRNA(His) 5'-end guanylyltransferase
MDKTSLGDRMKDYEACSQSTLLRRTPVIIRVDGKAFHTFTKQFDTSKDPFNDIMHNAMTRTAQAMMQFMQNAQIAYTQSDEISILLRDWDKHETQQWFGGKLQKVVSVSAAMATGYFNFFLEDYQDAHYVGAVPLFDSRAFQLPKEEVANYFIWRQQDATRNSVQMLGRHYFSHKEMNGKNVSEIQDMLMTQHNVNWNDIDTWKKRGTCVIPNPNRFDSSSAWYQDEEIPIFTKDRDYIESRLMPEEE